MYNEMTYAHKRYKDNEILYLYMKCSAHYIFDIFACVSTYVNISK